MVIEGRRRRRRLNGLTALIIHAQVDLNSKRMRRDHRTIQARHPAIRRLRTPPPPTSFRIRFLPHALFSDVWRTNDRTYGEYLHANLSLIYRHAEKYIQCVQLGKLTNYQHSTGKCNKVSTCALMHSLHRIDSRLMRRVKLRKPGKFSLCHRRRRSAVVGGGSGIGENMKVVRT